MDLNQLLLDAVNRGASDVHLRAGVAPSVRVDGRLQRVGEPISVADAEDLAFGLMPEANRREFLTGNESDFAHEVEGVGRFRVNVFRQQGTVALVLRSVATDLPSIESLGLPQVVRRIADEPRGLVLVTGRVGTGKSTTLAALIDHINQTRDGHILTIEDPIEYQHTSNRCLVTQREIGLDTEGFHGALKRVLRQDPDVILIGEMRDAETVSAALSAAETGQLVLSTLHTINATETVNRVLDFFDPRQHAQVRNALAASLRGVVSQRLLRRADGAGRVPTVEIMVGTGRVAERIADPGRADELEEVIADGAIYGMQTFDQNLLQLYATGTITARDALGASTHPHDLQLAINSHDAEVAVRVAVGASAEAR